MKNQNKKNSITHLIKHVFVKTASMGIILASTVLVAFATDAGTGAETALTNFVNFLFTITRIIGIAGALWALIQIGIAIKSHDPSSRDQGVLSLAGALVILFAKEILTFIGVSL